jgi:hypothetical protein
MTQIKLTPLKGELQNYFVTCERCKITPIVATRRTTIDMTVKWCLNLRKWTEFKHGEFLWHFLRIPL